MNNKPIPWIAALVVVTLLGGAFFFSEHGARTQKERELALKMSELGAVQQEVETLNQKRKETEEAFNAKIALLESTLKENTENAKTLNDKLDALEKEKSSLMDDNLEKSKTIETLNKKITDLETSKQELLGKILELQESGSDDAESRKKSENTPYGIQPTSNPKMDAVNLGKIVVQRGSGRAAQVAQVNPVYNFIVINAGERDGIQQGAVVNIVRDDRLIGKAVVQKTRPNIAAAVLLPEWNKDVIQPGDFVTKF